MGPYNVPASAHCSLKLFRVTVRVTSCETTAIRVGGAGIRQGSTIVVSGLRIEPDGSVIQLDG